MCSTAEMPALATCRVLIGRVAHRCCECAAPIAPGEAHERVNGLWDGRWDAFRTCLPCTTLREAVVEHELAGGCWAHESAPAFGDLWITAVDAGLVEDVGRALRCDRSDQ